MKTQELRYLIQLLEDESIRASVLSELGSFGNSLEEELEKQHIPVSAENALLIRPLFAQQYREWLTREWRSWFNDDDDKQRLEAGLDLLARFQFGRLYPARLGELLDGLADEYETKYAQRDALELSDFLFQGYGLTGAEPEDYYNPLNSNLVHVIEQRRGIPISLACIYILVGHRLGLKIEGCNFPGHFLAVASTKRQKIIVDCFNGGTFIDEDTLTSANAQISKDDILRMQCTAQMIIARVLRNLVSAYGQTGDDATVNTLGEILSSFENTE